MHRLLICLLLLSFDSRADLHFNVSFPNYKYTQEAVKNYQDKLTDSLGAEVVFRPAEDFPDIIISSENQKDVGYTRAQVYIDLIPPFISVSNSEGPIIEKANLAVVRSPIQYRLNKPAIEVASFKSAVELLQRGRVDTVIDSFDSQGVYQLANDKFHITRIAEEQPVSVWFRNAELAGTFDKQRIQADSILVDNHLKRASDNVDVFLLYKYYNPQSKKFEALNKEESVANWLFREVLNQEIAIKHSNGRTVFETLASTQNSCAINVIKRPEREEVAVFSSPTIHYLGPALYSKRDSELERRLRNVETNSISFAQLLDLYPQAVLGYTDVLASLLPQDLLSGSSLVNLSPSSNGDTINLDYQHSLAMLEKQRVDGLIEYPIVFSEVYKQDGIDDRYLGIQLNLQRPDSVGYLACSDSVKGRQLVTLLTEFMRDYAFRAKLMDLQLAGYNEKQKIEGMRLINLHY